MAEYINRDELIKGLVEDDPVRIAALCEPTADVAPVVRCKECKYFQYGDYCIEDKMEHSHCHEDDYCSYGERREEA